MAKALYVLTLRADSDHMERISHPTQDAERGFGLVEAVIATALFVILLVISIGPIMASLRRLDTARLNTEAEKLGEAQLEAIRALEFDDVGLTAGNPSGVLPDTVTMTGDTAWIIKTDVQWEGAVTGIDVANYKTVDITVTHPTGAVDPVSFTSIISPDRLQDTSTRATVNVDFTLMEPTPSGAGTPQLYLIKTDGLGTESGSVFPLAGTTTEFTFPLLNPTDPNPGDPNHEMVMRLGPNLADTDALGWHIAPNALATGSDTFQLFEAQVLDTVLPIYRPAILEVFVEDNDTGLPINDATLTLFNGTITDTFTTTDGRFYIENAYGYPLVPDTYDITVTAAGYAGETRSAVVIPAGYPTPLHQETFKLEVQTGDPVLVTVEEASYVIPNATLYLDGVQVAVTDEYGQATIFVPTGSHALKVTNEVGFDEENRTITNTTGSITVVTSMPSNFRAVHLRRGGDGDHWGYRERYDPDDYVEVARDYNGNGVFAVRIYRTYDTALICDDDSVGAQKNKYVNGTEWVSYGWAGC